MVSRPVLRMNKENFANLNGGSGKGREVLFIPPELFVGKAGRLVTLKQ